MIARRVTRPLGWPHRLRAWLRPRAIASALANAVRPQSRDDREALMFLAGEAWMACILGGAWLLTRFL